MDRGVGEGGGLSRAGRPGEQRRSAVALEGGGGWGRGRGGWGRGTAEGGAEGTAEGTGGGGGRAGIGAGSLTGRHGAANARAVARSCSERPFSVLEWRFHGLIRELGPGWAFNVEIHDEDGLVGVVDAVHWASRTIVELDGRAYHGDDRFQSDRTRDQRLAAMGFVVIRLTWDDVTRRSGEVLKRIASTVASRTSAA